MHQLQRTCKLIRSKIRNAEMELAINYRKWKIGELLIGTGSLIFIDDGSCVNSAVCQFKERCSRPNWEELHHAANNDPKHTSKTQQQTSQGNPQTRHFTS